MRSPASRTLRCLAVAAAALAALAGALGASAAEPLHVDEPLSFAVDPGLRPTVDAVPGPDGAEAWPLVGAADGFGSKADFVADQLVVATSDDTVLRDLLERLHAVVVQSFDPASAGLEGLKRYYLLHVDPSAEPTDGLVDDVIWLAPGVAGP